MHVPIERREAEIYLERILASPDFRSSPKCRAFLRFVVERTVEGAGESLKERAIAEQVFDRGPAYNPAEDSLVRVKASELRRRLAQYYSGTGKLEKWQVTLPLGGYVPHFIPHRAAPEPEILPSPVKSSRRTILSVVASAVTIAGVGVAAKLLSRRTPLQEFWAPVMNSPKALLIFLPVPVSYIAAKNPGEYHVHSDRVGLGAVHGAIRFLELCIRTGKAYSIKSGADLSFSDLRDHPSVLFGAFSSKWTRQFNNQYRFRLEPEGVIGRIVDSQRPGREWLPTGKLTDGSADLDYCIGGRILDPSSGQTVIIASGITTFGTQAAAEFLTSPEAMTQLSKLAPRPLGEGNFQVLLRTKVIGNTPGFPSIVEIHFW